jgi:outer membrane murein-binding lipoprotein Lpp
MAATRNATARPRLRHARRGAALAALTLAGCGSTVASTNFSGEQHAVAQVIANLQSDVNAGEEQKICDKDVASEVVARLNAISGGCKQAIKEQLAEIDNAEVKVDSVQLGSGPAANTATARVRTIYSGKTRASTVSLRKQGGKWKLAAIE